MISVIVPARDAAATLPACLAALAGQTAPCEVIVVDDGSRDATPRIARQHEGVRCLSIPPSGPAAARNAGAEAAAGELLLFTDADCAPDPDWAVQLSAPFADPAVVGAKGVYRTQQRGLMPRFVQLEYEFKYRRMARLPQIDFIDTYSAAYRREPFLSNGGFETSFSTASVEDQELSFRLAEKGYRLVFVPSAVVAHIHDKNLSEYARRKFKIGYWKAFLLRWHPEKAVSDTHTPPGQRLQILALALLAALVVAGPVYPPAWWVALLAALAFYATALPFLGFVARRDPGVLPLAPLALLLRAAALGTGLALGMLDPRLRVAPRRPALSLLERTLKRGLDLIGACVGLPLSLPLGALVALAIKLDSPGPVLFVQERVGENGRTFRMVKFRSMVRDACEQFERAAAANPLPGPAVKLPRDPRVTRAGRFLRRWSLDELPQLWNVLCGEMSLVGPRPEEPRVVAQYNDWHRRRLAVRPGLTGPMQVNGRGELPLDERVRLELEYIEGYSFGRDVVILLQSIPAVISGRGAF